MKSTYIVGIAVLLAILAASWFTRSQDQRISLSAPTDSSALDARQTRGGVEMQQRGSQQHLTPSNGATTGRDVGPDAATAVRAGDAGLARSDIGQAAIRHVSTATPELPADTESSPSPEIDKTACEAVAKTLQDSWRIFDVTPTQAVVYARNSSPIPHSPPSAFTTLKARLLATLCSGNDAFTQDYAAETELVAIGPDSHARIVVGDHWISDGTVLSVLSEVDQEFFANSFLQARRRLGPGPGKNLFRDDFERRLAQNPRGLIAE